MTYVQGIGDEVLLFFTFVIASLGILLFLILRETFRRNNISHQGSHISVDAPASFDDNNNLQASSTLSESYSDFQQETPVSSSQYFSTTGEENLNDTENITEGARSNEQQITLRLILQEQTINTQVFYSTTLQDLKRYTSNLAKMHYVNVVSQPRPLFFFYIGMGKKNFFDRLNFFPFIAIEKSSLGCKTNVNDPDTL